MDRVENKIVAFGFVERSILFSGFRRFLSEQAFYLVSILGIAILVAVFFAARLSRPLEKLVDATRVLETGDFSVRVDEKRKDEIGDLAQAFNHMGEALHDREVQLKEAQSALVQNEKLAALGTLSAGIAHEVKNPLAGILGHADLAANQIRERMSPEEQPAVLRYIETIQKEVKRCRGIIDSLMRFSRQEKASLEATDLELVSWEAIHLMEHPLNMAKVKIQKEFAKEIPMVLGNPNQIEQVVLNMLQNAGHAMENGGTITVGTEFHENPSLAHVGRLVAYKSDEFQGPFVRILVRDTGVGMSEEVQRKIFEPFFTTKPKGKGTGLGLSVTMGILADHKARISIDSAPGQGTAFYIDFMAKEPRTREALAALEEVRTRKGSQQKLESDASSIDFSEATTVVSKPPTPRPSSLPPPPPTPTTMTPPAPSSGEFSGAGSNTKSREMTVSKRFKVRPPKANE